MPKQWTGSSQQNHSEIFRATFCCNFYTQLNYNWQRRSNAAGECAMTWLSWYPVHCEWTTVNCDWLPDRAGTQFTVCVAGSHHSVWCSGPTAAPGSHSSQWSWGSAPDTHRHIHNACHSVITGSLAHYTHTLSLSFSPFNRPFSRWTWISRRLLKQRIMEVVVMTGDMSCKAPFKSSPPTNQYPSFYRPDDLPVAQPTVSKHWSGLIIHCQSKKVPFYA